MGKMARKLGYDLSKNKDPIFKLILGHPTFDTEKQVIYQYFDDKIMDVLLYKAFES